VSAKLYKNCPECGKALMKTVAVCPQCGKKQFGVWHHTKKVLGALFLAFIAFSIFDAVTDNTQPVLSQKDTAARQSPLIQIPADQNEFVAVVEKHRSMLSGAKNNIVKKEVRNARASALMEADVAQFVGGWIGEVSSIDVAGDDGVFSVEVGDDIRITTWNNELSDISDETLIKRGSEPYISLMNLSRGDKVRIAGEFLPSEEDYFKEVSLTLDGAMQDPEFLFRFKSITPVK